MEKLEVTQKVICTLRWSENIRFYIFTSENIKYTLYINNIFMYFTTLNLIKLHLIIEGVSARTWLRPTTIIPSYFIGIRNDAKY